MGLQDSLSSSSAKEAVPVRPESMAAMDELRQRRGGCEAALASRALSVCASRRRRRRQTSVKNEERTNPGDVVRQNPCRPLIFPPWPDSRRGCRSQVVAVVGERGGRRDRRACPGCVQQVRTALYCLARSLLSLSGHPDLSCFHLGCRRCAQSKGEWHPPPRLRPGPLTSMTSSPSSWKSVGAVQASRST